MKDILLNVVEEIKINNNIVIYVYKYFNYKIGFKSIINKIVCEYKVG